MNVELARGSWRGAVVLDLYLTAYSLIVWSGGTNSLERRD